MPNTPSLDQYNTTDQKPQYHLIWDAVDEKHFVRRNIHETYTNRDDAIAAFNGLKASGAANIRGFCDIDKCIAIDVEFVPNGKRYTYLHKELAELNQLAVVRTKDGYTVVKVVGCSIKTHKELSAKMPFGNYKYLVGLVK